MDNDATHSMADFEMKEETFADPPLHSIQQADITDPHPAPSANTSTNGYALTSDTHSPALAPPSAATPPVTSSPNARPGSMPPQPSARPEKSIAHGGPTRQYLNQNLTPHLLEGMKYVATHEPEKPLLWLSEFLRQRSKEVEG